MKKWLAAAVALLPITSIAAEWWPYSGNKSGVYLVDLSKPLGVGPQKKTWIKAIKPNGQYDHMQISMNCEESFMVIEYGISYSATHEVLAQGGPNERTKLPIAPGSTVELLYDAICNEDPRAYLTAKGLSAVQQPEEAAQRFFQAK